MYVYLFKQKTAYEVRISDLSSDVCSSDLRQLGRLGHDRAVDVAGPPAAGSDVGHGPAEQLDAVGPRVGGVGVREVLTDVTQARRTEQGVDHGVGDDVGIAVAREARHASEDHAAEHRSAEHTSELQSPMRTS